MEEKGFCITLAIILAFLLLVAVVFGVSHCDVFVNESPNGDYQIVSFWIDKGGFGYGGAHYIKENGLFSKWHKIEKVPSSCEWVSDTQFTIYRPFPDNDKEYNVNDFFDK